MSELQQEELEVLKSIYEGDDQFKIIDEKTFQCKIGEDNKTFLLEIRWPNLYPDENPDLNLDLFFNKHLTQDVKNSIYRRLKDEAELNAGTAMTYTLFEWAKENYLDLLSNQPENAIPTAADVMDDDDNLDEHKIESVKKEKKIQLTKAQKRKQTDRLDNKGERPRGWDWIDVVKHLSQSGSNNFKPVDDL